MTDNLPEEQGTGEHTVTEELNCWCSEWCRLPSEKAAVLQVILDDDVGDGVKHKLHVLGVSCAGEVGVDLLCVLSLVQVLKLALDVSRRLLVGVGA